MSCVTDNHNNMCHICAKDFFFLDLNFNYAVIDKISKIAPNFTYSQTS